MAIAFPESNSVMVTAPALILDACEQVIAAVDVEPKQVYIEARFVELSNDVFRDIGIDWSMLDGMKGSVTLGGGIQKNRLGKGVQDYTRTLKDGTASYSLSGSTLVGDADGGNLGGIYLALLEHAEHDLALAFPNFFRVVLNPAGAREMLGELLLADGAGDAVVIKDDGTGTAGSLIECENILFHNCNHKYNYILVNLQIL